MEYLKYYSRERKISLIPKSIVSLVCLLPYSFEQNEKNTTNLIYGAISIKLLWCNLQITHALLGERRSGGVRFINF